MALIVDVARTTDLILFQAENALPLNDDEWGSERQIAAQNLFFESLEAVLSPPAFRRLEAFCSGATTDEMVCEGVRSYFRAVRRGQLEFGTTH